MKFWKAFVVVTLLSATAGAQQLYRGIPYLNPYFTQPYYPVPFGLPTYSALDPLAVQQSVLPFTSPTPTSTFATEDLRQQVQQLTDQVSSLQTQLLTARQELTQACAVQASAPSNEPVAPIVIVLKNGQTIESQGYVVAGEKVWILTPNGRDLLLREELDVPATQTQNLKRGIKVPDLGN
jgi:hypothetical protein